MKTQQSFRWNGAGMERLERRRTPSTTAGVAIVAAAQSSGDLRTTPADGDVVDAANAPDALIFRFNANPSTIWADYNVAFSRIEADGSETPIFDGYNSVAGVIDDAAGTVSLPLKGPLEPGRYRLALIGGGPLSAALSRSAALSQQGWDATQDHVVAEFEVKAPDRSAGAADLGLLGPAVLRVQGNLTNSGTDFAAYRIRLGAGRELWQLGLQLDAERIGSPLNAELKVYDEAGNDVAATHFGANLPLAYPNDPYLFVGLAPGDYVVVVSRSEGRPGGAFQLDLVADPVTAPARVTDFTLDRTDGAVTGFTIAFSSAVDPSRLLTDAIRVVDGRGGAHLVELTKVDPGLQRVAFQFVERLPDGDELIQSLAAGSYSLIASGDAPIADLIGRIPVADGVPAGTLARWTVSPEEGSKFKVARHVSLGGGVITLAPGESTEFPFVIADDSPLVQMDGDALLSLGVNLTGGSLRFEVFDGGLRVLQSGSASLTSAIPLVLGPGSYVLRLTAAGDAPLVATWILTRGHSDSLIGNAIGSNGALSLRLGADPGATTPTPSPPRPPVEVPGSASAAGFPMGPSPWAYVANNGSGLVGRPSTNGDGVAAVGPTVPGGLNAVAWGGPGVGLNGLASSLVLSSNVQADDGASRGPAGFVEDAAEPSNRDDAVKVAASEGDADDAALRRADRVVEAVRSGLRWLVDGPEPLAGPVAAIAAGDRLDGRVIALAEAVDPNGDGPSRGVVEQSAFDLPIGVLFVTASVVHLRRALPRWWRKRRAVAAPASAPAKSIYHGPRRMAPLDLRSRARDSDRV
ncbi:hypothetical protein [Paludisphaera mucosa]|uniref:Peptidase C-terminal archaeal/bacterial domain-containing protein n=1 Tax=Paludisphaera mucosa TaxID=3030827 RepID=A0ABT6FE10_9BACT|nr:hypothetical protein [Paludisphaera mucosa]MDG3005623.1 hypothetical protein [Paludisphaera mucosa]